MKKLLLTASLKIKTITELVGYQKPSKILMIFQETFGHNLVITAESLKINLAAD